MPDTLSAPPAETPTDTPTPETPTPTEGDQPTPGTSDTPAPTEGEPKPEEVTYALTLPEGSTLDEAAVERTVAYARERGLSNEQAQAALELASQEAKGALEAYLAAVQPGGAEHARIVDGWKDETLADPALGQTPEERTAAIQRGHLVVQKYREQHPEQAESFVSMLNESGYGNHKDVARFMAWLGTIASEKPLVFGSHAPRPKTAAEIIYPTMQP